MSFARVFTRALLGLESPLVAVEVHASRGLPSFSIVGLPEASVRESRERVRSALLSSGFDIPPMRITVNLAPADLPKSGGRYDMAIAIGLLIATGQLQWPEVEAFEFYGELSLDGQIRPVVGLLPSVLQCKTELRIACIAQENLAEAALALKPEETSATFVCFKTLGELCHWSQQENKILAQTLPEISAESVPVFEHCLSDVRGQLQAKRALEICASGGHSMLMVGPPGAGKSMLASRLASILPPLTHEQSIEVASIRSLSGESVDAQSFFQRPFQQIHHSSSVAALIGGGSFPKPGAISKAHHGVLFLDELPEFHRNALEALREPLETGWVDIARVQQQVRFPAQCQLIVAMNPTPSGFFPDDPKGRCKDTPAQVSNYLKKISGPLLDRIDCHIELTAMGIDELVQAQDSLAETSEVVRKRVEQAQHRQMHRQGCLNARLSPKQLNQLIVLDEAQQSFLSRVSSQMGLSARGYHRLLRVALTLSDMAAEPLALSHMAEALSYRQSHRITEFM